MIALVLGGTDRSPCCGARLGGARRHRLRLQRDRHQRLPNGCRDAHGRRRVQPRVRLRPLRWRLSLHERRRPGPATGCLAGEGVRWDTVDVLRSTNFKCTGAATEPLKTAITDENTVGLARGLLPCGRRERRVLHGADDRLRRRHRAGHRRDPERLDSGCRLRFRDYELQQLRPPQARRQHRLPRSTTLAAGATPWAPQKPSARPVIAASAPVPTTRTRRYMT